MTPLIDDEIRRLIGEHIRHCPSDTPADARTLDDLGFDSLDVIELAIEIEDGFALPPQMWTGNHWTQRTTVGQVIADTRDALEAKAAGK